MVQYARWLFGISALVNFSVSALLLLLSDASARQLALDPIIGTNMVLCNFAALVIGLFGYAYLRIAMDPLKFRPFVQLGVAGKLLAFVSAALPWLMGAIPSTLALLVSADVIFAALFIDYLWRTRTSAGM